MNGGHVLVAEDERGLQFIMALMLRQANYKVSLADNGLEAYDIILAAQQGTEPVNLLVADLQMPELGGDELIARLEEAAIKLPIIVITGYPEEEFDLGAARRGLVTCINKPFEPKTFIECVQAMLANEGRF
jgi:DNA-binding response OmpR family regulator